MEEMAITTVGDLAVLAERVLTLVSEKRPGGGGATVLALHGELGAGKTTFTQTLATLLGVKEYVTSPTFVIMRLYPVPEHALFRKLVHVDAYRVESLAELDVIGFKDVLADASNLACVEWAGRVAEALPPDALHVTFTQPDTAHGLRTVSYGYTPRANDKEADQHVYDPEQ